VITAVEPAGRGLGTAIRDALPLLISVALLLAGGGLAATLLGARAGLEGFRPSVIGVVLAGYYAGYVGGSMVAPSAIDRVGHVRVFAGLAALASGALLLHVVFIEPITWFVLRAIVGLCISALYVVCETWLNGVSTNRTRGGLMASYMIVVSGSLLIGQSLYAAVGARGFEPFVLASVLVSLAVVPVSLATFPAPRLPEPTPISMRRITEIAPLAVLGAALAGFIGAAMLSAGVVYATAAGFNRFATAAFVGAALAGGVALQLPLGSWSDRVDRRIVITVTAAVAAIVAVVASQVHTDRRLVLIALTTVAGGSAFPIYSLSVAHLNDYLDDASTVAAGAKMVLINGVGSVAGPIVGSMAVGLVSPGSLFVTLAVAYVIVGSYSAFRMTRRSAAQEEARATFTPVVVGVGPLSTIIGEADVPEIYPVGTGDAEFGEVVVHFQERGMGPPVVLIGDVEGRTSEVWDDLLGPLAADGIRAVAPQLGSGRTAENVENDEDEENDEVGEAVLSVLRHLEIPSATFVGCASGSRVALRLARDHADRTAAVVLLVDADGHEAPDTSEVAQPTLVLDRRLLATSPSDVADDIAEFTRPIAADRANRWETGQFDIVRVDDTDDPDDPDEPDDDHLSG
jgi:MFS family permease/pimeloyl-ACP methyl ester carboxylesterase